MVPPGAVKIIASRTSDAGLGSSGRSRQPCLSQRCFETPSLPWKRVRLDSPVKVRHTTAGLNSSRHRPADFPTRKLAINQTARKASTARVAETGST